MHTPGPWGIIHNEQSLAVVKSEDKLLYIIVDHRRDFGAVEPDARLIAAAPELLEACKAVLARGCSCQSTESENWHAPGSVLAPACPIPLVKAAVAMAEGGSNGDLST